MQTSSIKYTVIIALFLTAASCKKFVERGDVNTNPNASVTANLKTLLPAIQDAAGSSQYSVAIATTNFGQQTAAYTSGFVDFDKNNDVRVESFYDLYSKGLTNAKIMIDLATAQKAPYYSAIGKIFTVIDLAMATDLYGDVPYSEAFQAPVVVYPKYDKQEDLYTLMQLYLDQAITEAQTPVVPGVEVPGKDDLIYGGKMSNWIEAANFLKARLYMHTTKKGAVAAANKALAVLPNAFKPTSTDLQLVYNTRNLNPWNQNIAKRVITGNFFLTPSKRFVETLNGTTYGIVDPRISKMMELKANATVYTGILNGDGTGGTVDITQATYYAKDVAPILFGTYAEQKLMEAEARFLAAGGTASSVGSTQAAYDAYLAGISANITKVGVDDASKNAYINSPQVAVTPANLTMELIMKEKQIALYLHPEAWVDVRRYDYNPLIFRGMALPKGQSPAMNGQFIRRSGLPNDEVSRNPNAKSAVKPTTEKVWWDL